MRTVPLLTQTDLIKKHHLTIRGNLGQHILADGNVAKKIVDLLDLQEGDLVLEIGPGLGALTWRILEIPVHYTAVEKDPRFLEILKQEAQSPDQTLRAKSMDWIHEDILKFDLENFFRKNNPSPNPLPSGERDRVRGRFKVISNLP